MSHAFAAWHRLRHHVAQGAVLVCSSTNRPVSGAGLHTCLQRCCSRQGQGKRCCPCCQFLQGLLSRASASKHNTQRSSMLCRAPYLFAAVLQQAGAGQEVLPLLSDPARAAFQGLSITARHNRAFHTYPFLQVRPPSSCETVALLVRAANESFLTVDVYKDMLHCQIVSPKAGTSVLCVLPSCCLWAECGLFVG